MNKCPNKKFKSSEDQLFSDWEMLVGRVGEDDAYKYWIANNYEIPTLDQLDLLTDKLISNYEVKYELTKGLNFLKDTKGNLMSSKNVRDFTSTLTWLAFAKRDLTYKKFNKYPKMSKIFEDILMELKKVHAVHSKYAVKEINDFALDNGAFETKEQNELVSQYYQHIIDNYDRYKDLVLADIKNMGYDLKSDKLSEVLEEGVNNDDLQIEAEIEFLEEGDVETGKKSFEDEATFRENSFKKLSGEVKRLLSFIPNEINVLGADSYVPMETVYRSLLEILANQNITFEQSIQLIRNKAIAKPYLEEVVNLLEDPELPEYIKSKFNHHFRLNYLEHNIIIHDIETNSFKSINANRNTAAGVILEQWLSNSIQSPIFKPNTDLTGTSINKEVINNQFKDSWNKIKENNYNVDDVKNWLDLIGIDVSIKTLEYLRDNSTQTEMVLKWEFLFDPKNTKSPFGVIYNHINNISEDTNVEIDNPLNTEQYIYKLAAIDSEFKESIITDSFLDIEKKSIFSYIAPRWLIERFHNLMTNKDGILETLKSLPISRFSWYLENLKNNSSFRKHFDIRPFGGLKSETGVKFNKMSPREQYVSSINLFINSQQGKAGEYKISHFLTPSKSDKTVLDQMTALRYNVKSTKLDFANKTFNINDKQILLNLVRGEYARIFDAQKKQEQGVNFKDIVGYNPFMFYSYNSLNKESLSEEEVSKLYTGDKLNEYSEEVEDFIWDKLKGEIYDQIEKMRSELTDLGIIENEKLNFVDQSYINDNANKDLVNYFLADYVINYNIAMSNYNLLFQGDTAAASKFDPIKNKWKSFKDVLANMFKRLAKDIAPARRGSKLETRPEFNKYKQIFLEDSFSQSFNQDQINSLFGNESRASKAYSQIEGTDAQELTTLEEHLDVMYHFGKLDTKRYDDLKSKVNRKDYKFTESELDIVLQPIKPLYSGNKLMPEYGAEIPVYIKSSSFPLVPQLVKGTEFEKLERQMSKNGIKRAVFLTGAKLGAFKPIDIWNKVVDETTKEEIKFKDRSLTNGTINEDVLIKALKNKQFLELDRDYFGIQQETPFDANKNSILEGSQLSKLILDGLRNDQKTIEKFNDLHNTIVNDSFNKFLGDIGATENSDGTYTFNNLVKLREILLEEVKERGTLLPNDILSLELNDAQTDFKVPIWGTPKSDQFETLLNSIITKKVIRQKMAGRSYILGTEEGFKTSKKNIKNVKSEIKYIKSSELQGTVYDPKTGLKPQRFGYVKNGEKIEESEWKTKSKNERDTYTKVVFPAQILIAKSKYNGKQILGYRIPTQGLNSMSAMEVVGYLPDYMGDLLIAPKDFTKQMGSDFDVDKIFTHTWYEGFNGRRYDAEAIKKEYNYLLTKQNSKNFIEYLSLKDKVSAGSILAEMFDTPEFKYTPEEIDEILDSLNNGFPTEEEYFKSRESKILKNEIMDIYWSTVTNNDNLKEVLKPLDNGNLDDVKKKLLEIYPEVDNHSYSPIYQIENYQNGTAGKFGVAVTSLLSTFNSLIQANKTNLKLVQEFNFLGEKRSLLNGSNDTLDGTNTKSNVISAFQSVSVDNIKELIIKLVNYNKHTHDAFVTLSLLGLNDTYISYFLAQPAIKEYVRQRNFLGDNFDDVAPNEVEDKAYKNTLEKLINTSIDKAKKTNTIPTLTSDNILDANKAWNKDFSEKDLLSSLSNIEEYDQAVLLFKFKEISKAGKDIAKVVRSIQPSTSGIGKDRIESNTKESMVKEVFGNRSKVAIIGLNSLLEINKKKTIVGTGIDILKKSNRLYDQLFKVNDVAKILISSISQNNGTDIFLTNKEQKQVVKFTKSYLYSSNLQMYKGKSLAEYRKELLIGDNSLAHRWKTYKKENPESWLGQRINTKITNSTTKPNRIEYKASQMDRNDDDKNTYELIEMLLSPDSQSRKLAEDTIAYVYLTGGNQDAISLLKFIPSTYLNTTEFGKTINYVVKNLNQEALVEQYFQHYPYTAATLPDEEFYTVQDGNIYVQPFGFSDRNTIPTYITGDNKLFKLTKSEDSRLKYIPLSNLGSQYITETVLDSLDTKSILNINNPEVTTDNKSSETLQTTFDTKIENVIPYVEGDINVKKGVNFVFEQAPELVNIGTKEQYSQYIDTIFPDSKVKDIVYHGTIEKELFEGSFKKGLTFFTNDKEVSDRYISQKDDAKFYIYGEDIDLNNFGLYNIAALVNIKNPFVETKESTYIKDSETIKKLNKAKYDGFVNDNVIDSYGIENQVVTFNTNQIYRLGTKEDIQNFKNYIEKQNNIEQSGKKDLNDIEKELEDDEFNMIIDKSNTQPDLNLKNKYFKESNVTNIEDILTKISESKHPLNTLAKSLLKYGKGLDTTIELTLDNDGRIDPKAAASYNNQTSSILIKADVNYGANGSEATILHEIIHALSVQELRFSNSKEVKELEDLYEYAKQFVSEDTYGVKNKYEFVAELFTNAAFINKLKEIPAKNNKQYKNFLQEFFDKLMSLFNINKGTTLYEQAFALSTNIIESQHLKVKLEMESMQLEDAYNSLEIPIFDEYTNEEVVKLIKKCK